MKFLIKLRKILFAKVPGWISAVCLLVSVSFTLGLISVLVYAEQINNFLSGHGFSF
jgi:hypothetical protein